MNPSKLHWRNTPESCQFFRLELSSVIFQKRIDVCHYTMLREKNEQAIMDWHVLIQN